MSDPVWTVYIFICIIMILSIIKSLWGMRKLSPDMPETKGKWLHTTKADGQALIEDYRVRPNDKMVLWVLYKNMWSKVYDNQGFPLYAQNEQVYGMYIVVGKDGSLKVEIMPAPCVGKTWEQIGNIDYAVEVLND